MEGSLQFALLGVRFGGFVSFNALFCEFEGSISFGSLLFAEARAAEKSAGGLFKARGTISRLRAAKPLMTRNIPLSKHLL